MSLSADVLESPAAVRQSPMVITVLLALLTAVGPISTDMYLPAFPVMKAALAARPGEAQMTLAAWFLGLSVGQLTHGPLADHYGRRRPLMFGTLLYTVASIGCALSESMTVLSWWRLWAAFGGAASLVIPRAVIADVVTDGVEATRMISRMVVVMGVVPVIAPTVGGLIAQYGSWRDIFWIAALYGGSCALLIHLLLPETARTRHSARLRIGESLARYVLVWRSRSFRSHALEGGFATFSLFAFLGGAPPVFLNHYNLTPAQFGEVFILNAVGYILGTQANARVAARFGPDRALTDGCLSLFGTVLIMLVLAITDRGGPIPMALAMMGCMGALGFVLPGAAVGSVLRNNRHAGAASALYGTTVFFVGAVSTALVGWIGSERPLAMVLLMLLGAALAFAFDRQRPRPR
ncbi:multidrug effflux MFS transporter [Rhizosaccharibacter radicis]|uniref:Bcr/CflA family efflux transporter n=1 Tax=Rhizosaccharibacter radicis TaxID=2782605 RepID=A0ABT1VWI3_9PROT|nr:multidrug effflux MFS transporter [Acetobacteraceae bacterium KSS12]